MTWWHWLLIAAGVTFAIYSAFVIWLVLAGRRQDARALAGFIPDCLLLFRRLLGDDRVPRRSELLLTALIGYLAMPVDLVPDVILSPASSTTRSSSRWCCARSCYAPAPTCCASIGQARTFR